jgi:hypothetical protein
MMILQVPVLFVCAHEVFHARGSAFEIGVAYGQDFQTKLEQVVAFKTTQQHVGVMAEWNELATQSRIAIQTYAPLYWQELLGMAQGSRLTIQQLLLLATEFEADMILPAPEESSVSSPSSTTKGCTGFVQLGNDNATSWIGQTNDDHPANWANGDWDVLLHLEIKELDYEPILVYTHVGIPAYLGMNRVRGVTWYYIDDGMRLKDNPQLSFLPTTVWIRQLLYNLGEEGGERHENDIMLQDYLRTIPQAVPNAFLILDHDPSSFQNYATAISIELSPVTQKSSIRQSSVPDSFLVHANHVVHSAQMWQTEVRLAGLDVGHKSIDRYQLLMEQLFSKRTLLDPTSTNATAYLDMLSTPPIHNDETLATVVMNPTQGCLYIQWFDKDRDHRLLSKNHRPIVVDYQRLCLFPTKPTVNGSLEAVS